MALCHGTDLDAGLATSDMARQHPQARCEYRGRRVGLDAPRRRNGVRHWCGALYGTDDAHPDAGLLWALRLSGHIIHRNWGEPEDRRYRDIRQKYEPHFALKSLGIIFWFQAGLAWIISMPLWPALTVPVEAGAFDVLAVTVWTVGMIFEGIGDWQLSRVQGRSGEPRQGDGPRTLALHTSSQLLRRVPDLVGLLPLCAGGRGLVDGRGAAAPHIHAFEILRRDAWWSRPSSSGDLRIERTSTSTNAFIPGPAKTGYA